MYLPFTTLCHDILQSCCGWFEQHVFSTLHLHNCKTIQNIRHLAIKEYHFALKNDKNASIISTKCQTTWDIFQGKLCRLSNTKKSEVKVRIFWEGNKICKISTLLLSTVHKVQIFWESYKNLALLPLFFWHYLVASNHKWKMGQIFEAFSKHLNFTFWLNNFTYLGTLRIK